MTDVKALLQDTNIPIAYESFYTAPPLPNMLILETITVRGADSKNKVADRGITLELYADKITPELEKKVEDKLNSLPVEYDKDRMWLTSEKMYETIYTFSLTEKI